MLIRERVTRRQLLKGLAAAVGFWGPLAHLAPVKAVAYSQDILPQGIRSRFIQGINGLDMHVLEAGFEESNRPLAVLLHGFPELAYSWRKVMVPLANAGYHVIAPDQRGYGRTKGWDGGYDGDLASYRWLNLVRDVLGLVFALGYRSAASVIGHDFGSPVAAWCAITRPDIFHSVVLMSGPFGGTPPPFDNANASAKNLGPIDDTLFEDLAALPRARNHYQHYYRTREANDNMWHAAQGVHAFLRAYYHYKSADWSGNKPFRLAARSAVEMAKMPTYYIMDGDVGMADTVAAEMPTAAQIAANTWLPDNELNVYSAEFARTGFQGGLNWYRAFGDPDMQIFAGRVINQPSMFIAGARDWGPYQNPGALERMQEQACTDMQGVHIVEGAGHWVQQEQPEHTSRLLTEFLKLNAPKLG